MFPLPLFSFFFLYFLLADKQELREPRCDGWILQLRGWWMGREIGIKLASFPGSRGVWSCDVAESAPNRITPESLGTYPKVDF